MTGHDDYSPAIADLICERQWRALRQSYQDRNMPARSIAISPRRLADIADVLTESELDRDRGDKRRRGDTACDRCCHASGDALRRRRQLNCQHRFPHGWLGCRSGCHRISERADAPSRPRHRLRQCETASRQQECPLRADILRLRRPDESKRHRLFSLYAFVAHALWTEGVAFVGIKNDKDIETSGLISSYSPANKSPESPGVGSAFPNISAHRGVGRSPAFSPLRMRPA